MTFASSKWRLLLGVSAFLVSAVALAVAVGVIPAVRAGTVPNITSDRAVPAFFVASGLQLLAAVLLLSVAALSKRRSGLSTSALVISAAVVLLVGFALGDAAKAPLEIGAPVQAVTVLLLGCVVADVLACGLGVAAALLRPREGLTSASS